LKLEITGVKNKKKRNLTRQIYVKVLNLTKKIACVFDVAAWAGINSAAAIFCTRS
jgi:hypothetical protein